MNRNEIKWFVIDYETEKNYIDQKFLLICFELKTCWAQGLKFSGLNSWGPSAVSIRLRFAHPAKVCTSLFKDEINSKPNYRHKNCHSERRFIQKDELNATEGK